jgi:TonB-linked SusC/RagA family outer membrane protein
MKSKTILSIINAFRKNRKSVFSYPIIKTFILFGLLFFLMPINNVKAQKSSVITGIVTDESGEYISGVSVVVKGTLKGTITDLNGHYSIEVPTGGTTLLFSFVGMLPAEVTIENRTTIDLVMLQDLIGLDEVIVVGYGTQKKESATGAISTVKSEDIVRTPVANVGNALVGLVAGISSVQFGGEPGNNEATIRIRGVATLNDAGADALVVIDGLQQNMELLNAMDPNEIESISVLKDASATAIYGIRGANGVIIITTKRGVSGKPQISFSSNFGITKATTLFNPLNSYEYALFRNEAIENDAITDGKLFFTDDELWKFQNNRDYTDAELEAMNLTPEQLAAAKASPAMYYGSHDYFKEQYGGSAPQAQINLNISGGNKDINYFASVGYFKQDGIINYDYYNTDVNSHYNRYNFRSNVDIKSIKNLTISLDLSAHFNSESGVSGGGGGRDNEDRYWSINQYLMESPPYIGPGIIDGKLVNGYVASLSPISAEKGGKGVAPINQYYNENIGSANTSNIITSINLKYELDYITKGLSVSSRFSYDDTYKKGSSKGNPVPRYSVARNPEDPAELLFYGGEVGNSFLNDNAGNYKMRKLYAEARINYDRSFGKHNVTAVVIGNAQKMTNPDLLYNVPEGLMGFAARTTYNFRERYLAEFNMAYNGSENFPEENRFGFFPSISAGWVVSKEPFFERVKFISWLKFRASYGLVGNDKIGGQRFLYLPSTWANYGSRINYYNGYFYGSTNGSSPNPYYPGSYEDKLGNPVVTWETAKKRNISMETRFLRDRLSVTAELFNEDRSDILWELGNVPLTAGATFPPANIGEVHNEGYELELSWRDTRGKFGYFVKGYLAYAKNKIIYKDEAPYKYDWMNETGFSIDQYKGYKNIGFFNNADEVNNRPFSSIDGNKVQPGDLRYVDVNGDGILDASDRVPIGFSNLPLYSFSTTVGFTYKGFDVSVLFTGSRDGSLPIASENLTTPFFKENGIAFDWQYEGRWTPEKVEQGITPTFPRAGFNNSSKNNGASLSDFWLRSNDYIKLKNIEVGYTFKTLAEKWKVQTIRLSFSANNVWLIKSSMIEGIDPEQREGTYTQRGFIYPMTSAYMGGINVEF